LFLVDGNPADSTSPPEFESGDRITFAISGYNGISAGGVVEF